MCTGVVWLDGVVCFDLGLIGFLGNATIFGLIPYTSLERSMLSLAFSNWRFVVSFGRPLSCRAGVSGRAVMVLVVSGLVVFGSGGAWAEADGVLTLATTTSTENSGLLAYLHPDFVKRTGIRVKVIARGTGACLMLAHEGDVDVVLVHAPDLEKEFVAGGVGAEASSGDVQRFCGGGACFGSGWDWGGARCGGGVGGYCVARRDVCVSR